MKMFLASLLLLLPINPSLAAEPAIGKFSAGDLAGWSDKEFKGKTVYTLVKDNGATVLKAHSFRTASGLIKEVDIDPKKYPILRWSWKIDHTLKHENIKKKSGDDFAARVYVVFPRIFFWRMRAITYVWSAKMPKGAVAPSPYTANSFIVAVESGEEKAGQWVAEERNVYDDYRKIFGEEPPRLRGIAVMTDTDDTHDEATAWYGDIFLEGPRKEKTVEKPLPADSDKGIPAKQLPPPPLPPASPPVAPASNPSPPPGTSLPRP